MLHTTREDPQVPEGDTIYRTARALRAALAGAEVTGVRTNVGQIRALGPQRLVGQTIGAVESRGKHLLCWFEPSRLALHTHMRMSGSWHTYRVGERWRRPAHLARVVIETADWVAVCFSAPVCELLSESQVERHLSLAALGPDALADAPDLDEARRRLDQRAEVAIGEALLDQRVLAGIGNVYKSEILFIHRLDPWTPVGDVPGATRTALLETAVGLLRQNAVTGAPPGRTTTERPGPRLYVYGRAGRGCLVCGTAIRSRRQGAQARTTYWCPRCQGEAVRETNEPRSVEDRGTVELAPDG